MIRPQFSHTDSPSEQASRSRPLRSVNSQSQTLNRNVNQFMLKEKEMEHSLLPLNKVMERTAMAVGLTRQTISRYLKAGKVETPDKKRKTRGSFSEIDDMTYDIIRNSV